MIVRNDQHDLDTNGLRNPSRLGDTSSVPYNEEETGVFSFAETLGEEEPPGEPWFMEMTRLRRFHFVHLNKRLAACKKKILEGRKVSDNDMKELSMLLQEQGKVRYIMNMQPNIW